MAKIMKRTGVISFIMTICFCLLYQANGNEVFFTLAITFGTIAYHFNIRLIIGTLLDLIMKNRADYTKKWYHVGNFEMKVYQKIKVKKERKTAHKSILQR